MYERYFNKGHLNSLAIFNFKSAIDTITDITNRFKKMRLVWSILFAVLCNAEQVTDVWPPDSSLDLSKEVTPSDEKHLRLLSSPVSRFHIIG
jgi:hypothetical protein